MTNSSIIVMDRSGAIINAAEISKREKIARDFAARIQIAGNDVSQRETEAMCLSYIRYIDRTPATMTSYCKYLLSWVAWLRYSGIVHPTREAVLAYKAYLAQSHSQITVDPEAPAGWKYITGKNGKRITVYLKASSQAAYLRGVKTFYEWAEVEDYATNIARNVHPAKVQTEMFERCALKPAQVQSIEQTILQSSESKTSAAEHAAKDRAGKVQRSSEQGKRMYAMFLLASNAGLRTIEISRARVKDLERTEQGAALRVWGKGRSSADQLIYIAAPVYEAILDYLRIRSAEVRPESPLFTATGNRSAGKEIDPRTISSMIKQAMKETGIDSPRYTAHSCRHTTATAAYEATGHNIDESMLQTRHKSYDSFNRYKHADTEQIQQRVAAGVWAYNHA